MDIWKYFAIGHEHHVFCNPLSEAKFDELIELLALPKGAQVVDVACGKAELLVRVARRWACRGVGVDISPQFVAAARSRVEAAGLSSSIDIVPGDGSEYHVEPGSVDAAFCIGASWIWSGLQGTLETLVSWTRPGGIVVVGEPFWIGEPSPEHLEAGGYEPSSFGTHPGNVETGLGLGLDFLHSIVSSQDDWDRYEGYQSYAAEHYARRNPTDPDLPDLMKNIRKGRSQYLKWGRDEIGWAVYMFLKPES